MRRRLGFAGFVSVLQAVLLLVHAFVYFTWVHFHGPGSGAWLAAAVIPAAFSFLAASLLAWRHSNPLLRGFYRAAAVWLGTFIYLFVAGVGCWITAAILALAGISLSGAGVVLAWYGAAVALSAYGVLNALATRVRHVTIALPNLPPAWRGRRVAFLSDLHLGHFWGAGFVQRLARRISKERPAAVWIGGDFFDGTAIDPRAAAAPLSDLKTPLGTFFVTGNHEEFHDEDKYVDGLRAVGVRILHNEKIELDGLQLAGVDYRDANQQQPFATLLAAMKLDAGRASILLTHAPNQLWVSEPAGISLQLSGHSHRGQFFPFTWMARRIYRQYVYGLSRQGRMQVYVSSGAGTWGPPLRIGSQPEIVILQFENRAV